MKKLSLLLLPLFLTACPKKLDLYNLTPEPCTISEVPFDQRFEMTATIFNAETNEWLTLTVCVHPNANAQAITWAAHCHPIISTPEKPTTPDADADL